MRGESLPSTTLAFPGRIRSRQIEIRAFWAFGWTTGRPLTMVETIFGKLIREWRRLPSRHNGFLRASSAVGADFGRSRPSDGLGTASSDGGKNLWQQGLAERRAGDEEDTERRKGTGREGKGARPEQNSATASGR